jgi:hypothetical protein
LTAVAPYPMTADEEAVLIDYATRFGHAVANRVPRLRDDLVAASLHGVAIAIAADAFPADPEGRRKFVGRSCWNMIRRELTQHLRRQPITFTDLGYVPAAEDPSGDHESRAADRDEFEAIAASLSGRTAEVFALAFGPVSLTLSEVGERLGIVHSTVHHHVKKIRGVVRWRQLVQEVRDV